MLSYEKPLLLLPRLPVPLPGQLGTPSDRLVPHDGKVGGASKVLGDGDGGVQVEDYVPPAPWWIHTHTAAQYPLG